MNAIVQVNDGLCLSDLTDLPSPVTAIDIQYTERQRVIALGCSNGYTRISATATRHNHLILNDQEMSLGSTGSQGKIQTSTSIDNKRVLSPWITV